MRLRPFLCPRNHFSQFLVIKQDETFGRYHKSSLEYFKELHAYENVARSRIEKNQTYFCLVAEHDLTQSSQFERLRPVS